MKKISLFAILLSAAAMTACTDYVAEIDEIRDEYVNGAHSPCGDLWCGPTHDTKFNGTGYWSNSYAIYEGGNAKIAFDGGFSDLYAYMYDMDNHYSIGGMFEFTGQSYDVVPYVTVSAILQPISEDYTLTPVDASSWGGLCIVYASTAPIHIYLGYSNSHYMSSEDRPTVRLDRTVSSDLSKYYVGDLPWDVFKQQDGVEFNTMYAVSQLTDIEIRFIESEELKSGSFRIYSIGRKGSCTRQN